MRSIQSHKFEIKQFHAPVTSVNDHRFGWLPNVFLKYFEDWLAFIEQRPGNVLAIVIFAHSNIFISWQTFEGLKITVHSIREAVRFFLQYHVKYVLTERFCQDPFENYFGQHRAKDARKIS